MQHLIQLLESSFGCRGGDLAYQRRVWRWGRACDQRQTMCLERTAAQAQHRQDPKTPVAASAANFASKVATNKG